MRLFHAITLIVISVVCGCENAKTSSQRALMDLRIVAVAPVNLPANVGMDVGRELVSPPWGLNQLKALTWTPVFSIARHGFYTVLHAADLILYPLYLPFGAEPWTVYQTDTFPLPIDPEKEKTFWDSVGDSGSLIFVGAGRLATTVGWAMLSIFGMGA